jgi:hypothetical protein
MADKAPGDHPQLTLTGRFAHFGSIRLNGISKIQGRLHSKLYRRFGGTRFGKWWASSVSADRRGQEVRCAAFGGADARPRR